MILGERDAPGQHQTAFGFVQRHLPGGDLAGEGVHRRHPAQMGRAGGYIAHLADLGGAGAGKDTIGQHIDVELPQVEAARHDLHGLLHPEHLRTVFQQGLTRRHNKIHDAAAQLFIRGNLSAGHSLASFCDLPWPAGQEFL